MVGAYERPLSLTTITSGLSVGRDVVERLPAHAAGQRAVADDGDHVTVLAAQRERLGQAVGVGQRGGRVRVLDRVVLGLGLARVAGQAAALAQQVEAVLAAGHDLVHVRLVAGVEQDPVLGRVEDPVQRQGQLDDAEVRAEVPAGTGDLVDQEVADLGGQQRELRPSTDHADRPGRRCGRAGRTRCFRTDPAECALMTGQSIRAAHAHCATGTTRAAHRRTRLTA